MRAESETNQGGLPTEVAISSTGLGDCPKCGYSLWGLGEDRCPECGLTATERSALLRTRYRRFRRQAFWESFANTLAVASIFVLGVTHEMATAGSVSSHDLLGTLFLYVLLTSVPLLSSLVVFLRKKPYDGDIPGSLVFGRYLVWTWFPVMILLVVSIIEEMGHSLVSLDTLTTYWALIVIVCNIVWSSFVIATARRSGVNRALVPAVLGAGNILLLIYGGLSCFFLMLASI